MKAEFKLDRKIKTIIVSASVLLGILTILLPTQAAASTCVEQKFEELAQTKNKSCTTTFKILRRMSKASKGLSVVNVDQRKSALYIGQEKSRRSKNSSFYFNERSRGPGMYFWIDTDFDGVTHNRVENCSDTELKLVRTYGVDFQKGLKYSDANIVFSNGKVVAMDVRYMQYGAWYDNKPSRELGEVEHYSIRCIQ